MVTYIRSDLQFILEQIKIAEAHAAYVANPLDPNAAPLYGVGQGGQVGSVPAYNLSMGLRTVDGTYNNLLPGQERWGAADNQFPEPLGTAYRPASGTPLDFDGPGGMPAIPTQGTYAPSNNPNSYVVDGTVRTISNLIVDQTLSNPAAVMVALQRAGSENPMADLAAIQPDIDEANSATAAAAVAQALETAAAASLALATTAQLNAETAYNAAVAADIYTPAANLADASDDAAGTAKAAMDAMISGVVNDTEGLGILDGFVNVNAADLPLITAAVATAQAAYAAALAVIGALPTSADPTGAQAVADSAQALHNNLVAI